MNATVAVSRPQTSLPAVSTPSGASIGASNPTAWGGKLQLVQASPWPRSSTPSGGVFPTLGRATSSGGIGLSRSSATRGGKRSCASAASLHLEEVRALGDDNAKEAAGSPRSSYQLLMSRLKSRAAKQEAESTKVFLADYRTTQVPSTANDRRLDALLKAAASRAEDLRVRSEETRNEVAVLETRLDQANHQSVDLATDVQLQALNAFERSQRRIQEDKQMEELQNLRDEANLNLQKAHRRLQAELIELRDYKVLIREYRRVRLEKVEVTLTRTVDGRTVRGCVREMIRHGAQRILSKLENTSLPLEPWMREVLLNTCHLEIRIEDAEAQLLLLRREALQTVQHEMKQMNAESKEARMSKLREGTLDTMENIRSQAHTKRMAEVSLLDGGLDASLVLPPSVGKGTEDAAQRWKRTAVPDASHARAAGNIVESLRRLLHDTRQNTAAVVCNRIRQAEKSGGAQTAADAVEWGRAVLTFLVSEEFAKQTLKELRKSAPQSKLSH